MSRFNRYVKGLVIMLAIIAVGVSCNNSGDNNNNNPTPADVDAAAQAMQDISPLDIAQAGLIAPSPMTARDMISSASVVPNMPPDDPRWFWLIHPSRIRGQDDHFPRIIEPLIAARYLLKLHSLATLPACATVGTVGICPPLNAAESCTTTITFDAAGCTVTAPVVGGSVTLVFNGALTSQSTVTQAAPLQFNTIVTTTNLKITDTVGNWVQYVGAVEEDYDASTPVGGFTLTQKSQAPNPMTLTSKSGFGLSAEGTRTVVVTTGTSVATSAVGTITFNLPALASVTLNITSAKTATMSGSNLNLTLDRTIVNPATTATYHRTANITLAPVNSPITIVTVNGTETLTAPAGTVTTAISNVTLDLACFVPKGGSVTITTPVRVITVTFSTACSCIANWADNQGNSGITDFCKRLADN